MWGRGPKSREIHRLLLSHREGSEDGQVQSMGQEARQEPEVQEESITVQDVLFEVGINPESSQPVQATPSDDLPSDQLHGDGAIPVKKPRARRSKFKAEES